MNEASVPEDSPAQPGPALFNVDGQPVYLGDKLYVEPRWHAHVGVRVVVDSRAVDGRVVLGALDGGSISIGVQSLSWTPHEEWDDHLALAAHMRAEDITASDLQIYRHGRSDAARYD